MKLATISYPIFADASQQNLVIKFLMNRKLRIIRHLVLLMPLASTFIPNIGAEIGDVIPDFKFIMKQVYTHGIFMFCLAVLIIYTNMLWLIPAVLFKNKYLLYVILTFVLGIVYFMGEYFHGNYIYKGLEKQIDLPGLNFKDFIDNIMLPLVFLGGTTGYMVFKKWLIDIQRLDELQKLQLQDELASLKNQVNPHFLFNTLNNLETLIQTDTAKASQVVHGLSDVLKYQIYDSNKELILLSKDIEILSQLLMLEKIRREQFSYEILVSDNMNGLLVPPLLFINFIDNALKHSLDNVHPSYIKIQFSLQQHVLLFSIENSKPSFIIQQHTGGLGLKNIRRRLLLLYGEHCIPELAEEPNKYSIKLKIPV